MSGYLKETFVEIYTDKDKDWGEILIVSFLWLIIASLCGLFLWFTAWIIDSSFLPIKEKEGTVISKYYNAEYDVTSYMQSGDVMIPYTTHYPAEYGITVQIDDKTDNIALNTLRWLSIEEGNKFCFQYTKGRILNTLYIKDFCK